MWKLGLECDGYIGQFKTKWEAIKYVQREERLIKRPKIKKLRKGYYKIMPIEILDYEDESYNEYWVEKE